MWAGAKAVPHMGTAIETVSLVLSKMIRGEGEVWPILQPLLQDIVHVLKANPELKMVFYRRDGNKVADRIANEVLSFLNNVPELYFVTVENYVIG